MFCVKCGRELSKGAKFCKRCGNEARQRSNIAHSKPSKTKTIIIVVAIIAITLSIMGFALLNGTFEPSDDFDELLVFPDAIQLHDEPDVFHYTYRSDVIIIQQPPLYSFIEDNGTFIITVYRPSAEIRELTFGNTFVFSPSRLNPEGIAGRITGIAEQDTNIIITARIPASLNEIFYEFELTRCLDVLTLAEEIVLVDELSDIYGLEIVRNRTSHVGLHAANANIGELNLDGSFRLYAPRLRVSISMSNVNYIVVTTAAHFELSASTQASFDQVIPLFVIPIRILGTGIDIIVGLRITADGHIHVAFTCRAGVQFGYMNNRPFVQPNLDYTFDFDLNARATISANIQAKARVLHIPVYGIQGYFGVGVQSNTEMQNRCPDSRCFVVKTFPLRGIKSLDGWGVLGGIEALQFEVDFAQNMPPTFWYYSDLALRRYCLHGGAQDVPLLSDSENERLYLESDIFAYSANGLRAFPAGGSRSIGETVFTKGIANAARDGVIGTPHLPLGTAHYNITGQGFTEITGIFGRIHDEGSNLTGVLGIYADGREIFSYRVSGDFDTPRDVNVSIPPGTHEISIVVGHEIVFLLQSEFGFMDAFFTRDPNYQPLPMRERFYLEQDIFATEITIGVIPQDESRFLRAGVAYYGGLSVSSGVSGATATYDIVGQGFTYFTGIIGTIGGGWGGTGWLTVSADGEMLDSIEISGGSQRINVPIPQGARHITFHMSGGIGGMGARVEYVVMEPHFSR